MSSGERAAVRDRIAAGRTEEEGQAAAVVVVGSYGWLPLHITLDCPM